MTERKTAEQFVEFTSGLRFPEGPVVLPGGDVIVCEMFGPRITRFAPDGSVVKRIDVPGGPNGAALGPDGALYVCNNGGCFTPVEAGGLVFPGPFDPGHYSGGRIERIDLNSGEVTAVYTHCDDIALRAPNDLVFDAEGGFWFTDHGIRHGRVSDRTGIYYARPDGSSITEVVFPTEAPNGIGLSPDGSTLYWAETHAGRVFQRAVTSPGHVEYRNAVDPSGLLAGLPGMQLFDSLAVDGAGNVCVATLIHGGITVIAPSGEILGHLATDDPITTNICFGGADGRTAFVTLSGTGRVVKLDWAYPGLAPKFSGLAF